MFLCQVSAPPHTHRAAQRPGTPSLIPLSRLLTSMASHTPAGISSSSLQVTEASIRETSISRRQVRIRLDSCHAERGRTRIRSSQAAGHRMTAL